VDFRLHHVFTRGVILSNHVYFIAFEIDTCR